MAHDNNFCIEDEVLETLEASIACGLRPGVVFWVWEILSPSLWPPPCSVASSMHGDPSMIIADTPGLVAAAEIGGMITGPRGEEVERLKVGEQL